MLLNKCSIFQGVVLFVFLMITSSARPDPLDPAVAADPFSRYRQKIPRIGKKLGDKVIAEYMDADAENIPYESNMSNFFLKSSKAVPRIGRRKDITLKPIATKYNFIPWINRQFNYNPKEIDEDFLSLEYFPSLRSSEIQEQKLSEDDK